MNALTIREQSVREFSTQPHRFSNWNRLSNFVNLSRTLRHGSTLWISLNSACALSLFSHRNRIIGESTDTFGTTMTFRPIPCERRDRSVPDGATRRLSSSKTATTTVTVTDRGDIRQITKTIEETSLTYSMKQLAQTPTSDPA